MYKKVLQELVFQGKTLAVYNDSYLINKKVVKLEYMHVPKVALMIARKENGEFLLIKQFRQALSGDSIEFPAGKVENTETPKKAACREASEEAGIQAVKVIKLGEVISSPEFSNEKVYVYLATEFQEVIAHPETHEKIKVLRMYEEDIKLAITSGKIKDGKTISAFFLYMQRQKANQLD